MNFRNAELLSKLETHPLRKTLAAALDVAERFRDEAEFVTGNRDLSPQGRQKALQAKLRAAVRDRRDAMIPLNEMNTRLEAKRAVIKQPTHDKTDLASAVLRVARMTYLRGLDSAGRAALLVGAKADPNYVDAMLEDQTLSGMTVNEDFIVEAAREQRLEGLFAAERAEIKELETVISEAQSVFDLARVDLQDASGMDGRVFEDFVTPIEQKRNAIWLIQSKPTDPVVAIFPEKHGTAEFQRLATPDEIRDGKFYRDQAEYQADRAAA